MLKKKLLLLLGQQGRAGRDNVDKSYTCNHNKTIIQLVSWCRVLTGLRSWDGGSLAPVPAG